MELYVVAGGQMDSLNRWQQDLNSQFLPMYKNGKKINYEDGGLTHRRLLVAPVQLFKIAFPKEELETVLSMVAPSNYIEERYSFLRRGFNMLRKLIGLKPIKYPTFVNPFTQPNQVDKAVFVIPLGIKTDKMNPDGTEMI